MTPTEWLLLANAVGAWAIAAVLLWAVLLVRGAAEVEEEADTPEPMGTQDDKFVTWGRKYLERMGPSIVHDMATAWSVFDPGKTIVRIREHAELGDWEITDGRVYL